MLFVVGILPAAPDHILSNDTALRVKLNILCLFLADKDRLVESEMDRRDDLLFAGLEERELYVREGNVDYFSLYGRIPETIQVALESALCLLLTDTRTSIQVSQNGSLSLIYVDLLLLNNILFRILFAELQSDLFLKVLHLFLKFSNSGHILTPEHYLLHKDKRIWVFGEVQSGDRVGQMEIEAERCVLALVVFDHAFEDDDVERHVLSVDGEQNRTGFVVDVDEVLLEVPRKLLPVFVTLNLAAFDGLLLLEVPTEVLVTPFLQLLQLLLLQHRLMLVSLLLVFEPFVSSLLHLSSLSLNDSATCRRPLLL